MAYDDINPKVTKAVEAFNNMNCAQAVFSTFAPDLGIDRISALKISFPFGGGLGRQGEICGAVAGALMALGLKYSNFSNPEENPKEVMYAKTVEFCQKFEAIHKSKLCRDLSGINSMDIEAWKKAGEEGVFTTLCPQFVATAAQILTEMGVE